MSRTKLDVVTALAESFGRAMSAPSMKIYIAALSELSDDEAKSAASIAVRRCKFFPTPSELIEFAKTGGIGFEAHALLAFEELERALDANKRSLMSPLVAAIARQLGGFPQLRSMPLSDFNTWKRKDFLAAHQSLSREHAGRLVALAGPSSDIAKALVGRMKRLPSREQVAAIEAENAQKFPA